jgi:omega-6 fatty acid desaturase (delta-12 desaturase)
MSDFSSSASTKPATPESPAAWRKIIAKYQKPSIGRAAWQLVNTLVPYGALWYLMYLSMSVSYWLVLPLAILAGLFVVRTFIIFHDCGHRSYFKSPIANDIVGFITGVLTLTPYYHWRSEHAIHHATSGHLDKRGTGDIWTMTVQEYLESSRWKRFAYRLARNPIVLFGLAPLYLFIIHQRFPSARANRRDRWSVYFMNIAVLGVSTGLVFIYGLLPYLFIHLTIVLVAGAVGIWMFYVQHQFEDVYWESGDQWDYTAAALQGSSFYKLPKVLQWFSGNIGYHHIHHLSPRIPNYNLERCHRADPVFQSVKPITFFASLKTLALRFWDEQLRKMVGYRHLREIRQQQQNGSSKPREEQELASKQ